MRPLAVIYWTRFVLAIIAGVISTYVTLALGDRGVNTILNGVTIALIVYLSTYYLFFKPSYKNKVEKQSKLMSQGIGIYFFTWLVFWILTYTILLGPVTA